jgi:hypothetical protein
MTSSTTSPPDHRQPEADCLRRHRSARERNHIRNHNVTRGDVRPFSRQHGPQFRFRLLERCARTQPAGHLQARARRIDLRRSRRERKPDLHAIPREPEALRHHADHRVRPALHEDRASDDRCIAAQRATPQQLADQGHGPPTRRSILRLEHTTDPRRRPRKLEQVGRDTCPGQKTERCPTLQCNIDLLEIVRRDHIVQRESRAPTLVFGCRQIEFVTATRVHVA